MACFEFFDDCLGITSTPLLAIYVPQQCQRRVRSIGKLDALLRLGQGVGIAALLDQHDAEGLVRSPEIRVEIDHSLTLPGSRIQIASIDVVLRYVVDNNQ